MEVGGTTTQGAIKRQVEEGVELAEPGFRERGGNVESEAAEKERRMRETARKQGR
jgi:hypothetical protein